LLRPAHEQAETTRRKIKQELRVDYPALLDVSALPAALLRALDERGPPRASG
jgi:hypothetical protein